MPRTRQRRVDVVELLVISRALGADPVELFAEIARSAGRVRPVALSIPDKDKI